MATEYHLDVAAARPFKPGGPQASPHGARDALLYRPRTREDTAGEEARRAARVVVRLALGRHNCPRLTRCDVHGDAVCDCRPCTSKQHEDDVAFALAALRVAGLAEAGPRGERHCAQCHQAKPESAYSERRAICQECRREYTNPAGTPVKEAPHAG